MLLSGIFSAHEGLKDNLSSITKLSYMKANLNNMLILSIESSCDETSAAVVKMTDTERQILSNFTASQIDTHKLYGGVVPEIASRAHIEAISNLTYSAIEESGISVSDIDLIGVTAYPGLIGALLVGVNFAKSLAYANNIPLVAVNHTHAHAAAAYFTYPELKPPYIALTASGGHTSISDVTSYTEFNLIGRTRDDAAGEAFDKVARVLGIPYPGGAELDRLASSGNSDAVSFPSAAIQGETFDFSFSGLKTSAINYINSTKQKYGDVNAADIAASFTKTIVTSISSRIESAAKYCKRDKIVLAGGVAANSHLREEIAFLCKKNQWKLYMPDLKLCGDNAAMIGAQAYFEYLSGKKDGITLNARATIE